MMRQPTDQLRAGHRPAELIPPGVHPTHVTVVLPAPRSYFGPVLLVLAASFGICAVILALAQLALAAAPFAGISAGGVTFSFFARRK
jgi:hypothetical protein